MGVDLRGARDWLVTELARGNGPLVLAGLSDTAWTLPYDVVMNPAQVPEHDV